MAEPVLVIDDNYHAAVELARILDELYIATHGVGGLSAAREAAREMKPALAWWTSIWPAASRASSWRRR
jgi:hypothetical protein